MKRLLFTIINTGIITFLMHGNVNAQLALNNSVSIKDRYKTEKYNLLNPEVYSKNNIDFRALKDFKKRFALINNVTWDVKDQGSIAVFSDDSIKTTVAYEKNGRWSYTIQRYHENKMPLDIRARVKSIYYDYTILNINEVHVPQQENTIYILNLQYNQNFKTVRVSGDDMDVIADFHS
jgi:hypothetical protein